MSTATSSAWEEVRRQYAGFWLRLGAFLIDWIIVTLAVLLSLMVLALVFPPVASLVDMTRWLPTVERTIETRAERSSTADGVRRVVSEKHIERTVVGIWKYHHRVVTTETSSLDARRDAGSPTRTVEHIRINPSTGAPTALPSLELALLLLPWLLYAAAMEAGPHRATIGKRAMEIGVQDLDAKPVSFQRALARNGLKVLSALPLLLGFLMAGWTRRKQALHDVLSGCTVVARHWG